MHYDFSISLSDRNSHISVNRHVNHTKKVDVINKTTSSHAYKYRFINTQPLFSRNSSSGVC